MSKPNLLLIMSDQHAARACGYSGHPNVRSPHLDRLAERGTVFTNAYCNSPSCAPSRASFFTGLYPSDCGAYCNATPWAGQVPTWGTALGNVGYHCEGTGKFDLHPDHPIGFGGQHHGHGHVHRPGHTTPRPDITSLFRCPGIYRWNERTMITGSGNPEPKEARTTEDALGFLSGKSPEANPPWAYYVGYNRPHPPFTGYQPYFEEALQEGIDLPEVPNAAIRGMHPVYEQLRHFKRCAIPFDIDDIRKARAGYYAMIREMDDDIGRVLDALDASGQADNTIVIYASDHGECLGENSLWNKGSLYDVAMRVPLLISGPGIPVGKTVDTPVSLVDLNATLLDLAGATAPDNQRGRSLRPLWEGGEDGPEAVFAENHTEGNITGNFMIRQGDWKLIRFAHYDDGCLFNLAEDPNEYTNRFNYPDCADIRDRLDRRLTEEFDCEAINDRAFAAQDAMRRLVLDPLSETELAEALANRLGTGLARALARRLRSGN